jgi:AraC family transcriptional regulator
MSDHTISRGVIVEGAARDQSTPIEIDTVSIYGLNHIAAGEGADDRVIRSLSSALEAAEQGQNRNSIEALRAAIVIRWAGLQSDLRASEGPGEPGPGGRQVRALQKWRLKRVVEYVDIHLSDKVSLMDLAAIAGLSRMHFASQFRVATGLRPHEFLLRRRIRRAEDLLRNSTTAIVEIALAVGFQTQAHFTTAFKRFVGCTPRQWRVINQAPTVPPLRNAGRAKITAAL